jgi:hypothetical protein
MLILHIIATVLLVSLAWDVHRGTKQIIARTDALLRREPPPP